MAKLMNQKRGIAFLQDHGWTRESGGNHIKMTKAGHRAIPLPDKGRQDYNRGFTNTIVKQAGLEKADWERWNSRSRSTTRTRDIGLRSPGLTSLNSRESPRTHGR